MISSLIAFIHNQVHAAELSNDPLPTVQENVATHKAVIVDVREPGEWKEGHIEGAISLPLSSLKKGVDASTLEHQLPKNEIVYYTLRHGITRSYSGEDFGEAWLRCAALKSGYEDLVKTGFEKAAD